MVLVNPEEVGYRTSPKQVLTHGHVALLVGPRSLICVSMINSVFRERIPLGAVLSFVVVVVVVFPRAHRVPRGSKHFLVTFSIRIHLVGVGCFGYVSYSTSSCRVG